MNVVHARCFKHAENNMHVRRAGYSEHVRHTVQRRPTCVYSVNTV